MAPRSVEKLMEANREVRKLLAELGALLEVSAAPQTTKRGNGMTITVSKTVRELAVEVPNATRVFETMGIDYCCGGGKSLEAACAASNLEISEVLKRLEQAMEAAAATDSRDWTQAPLDELTAHIVGKHHAYIRAEVPRLQALAAKVAGKHGPNHPELGQVREVFEELAAELASHMMKEEQVLFPYIEGMARGQAGHSCFGTVRNPIRMMEFEHDHAGAALRTLREATRDYTLPQESCGSYAALYQGLEEFERDLHQHIHLENNILHPRAIALESGA